MPDATMTRLSNVDAIAYGDAAPVPRFVAGVDRRRFGERHQSPHHKTRAVFSAFMFGGAAQLWVNRRLWIVWWRLGGLEWLPHTPRASRC